MDARCKEEILQWSDRGCVMQQASGRKEEGVRKAKKRMESRRNRCNA